MDSLLLRIFSDPDYHRMRKALGLRKSRQLHGHYLIFRYHLETIGEIDRHDPECWAGFYEFTPLPAETELPDPALNEAETLFGLHGHDYDRDAFQEATDQHFADLKRRGALGESYSRALLARRTIQRARGWQ